MKKNTFKEEFNWLSQYLPEALITSPQTGSEGVNIFDNILGTIIQELRNATNNLENLDTLMPSQIQPEIVPWGSNSVTFDNLFDSLLELYNSTESTIPDTVLSALTAELGREACGMYLPMHYYFQSKKTPWGIYLFADTILPSAKDLYEAKGKAMGLTLRQVQYAFTYAVFRHELFHHQVEKFSTKHEILTHQVNYKTYDSEVNWATRNSENWLEEALAESTVLNSVHVFRNIDLKSSTFQKLYEFDLKRMPPGYRDYHCRKFGGPEKAHQLFASQIIQCKVDVSPAPATKLCTVSANEFSTSWKKVPIYMVKLNGPENIDSPREILEDTYKLF